MKPIYWGWLFILFVFVICVEAADSSRLERILPKEMEKQGWKSEDEPVIAVDERTLAMVINGAAPRYMELGTRSAAFVYYEHEKEQTWLTLEIFETDSKKNAERLFGEFTSGKSAPLENLGARARSTSELGGTWMVEYVQDVFYVRLSITRKTESTGKSVLKCANLISAKIVETGG